MNGLQEGSRHTSLCSAFGRDLKKDGFSPDTVSKLFAAAARNNYPVDEVVNEILPIAAKDAQAKEEASVEKFVWLSDFASTVATEIEEGTTAQPFSCGKGEFEKFCLLPGTITLIGAQTGAGKTALAVQMVFDALLNKLGSLKALVANVEVSPEMLFKRQVARFSAVPFKDIQSGQISNGLIEQDKPSR